MTVTELIRDTTFGHLLRLGSNRRLLQYAEERDPSLYTRFIDEEKSGYIAHHGEPTTPNDPENIDRTLGGVRTREANGSPDLPGQSATNGRSASNDTSQTRVNDDNAEYNHASGVKIDPEKGRDVHLVTWWGDNDSENPQNWSLVKKCFVTFEICLLTTSVYIGSSIYSPGEESVSEIFGVSKVAATLGLTLFVAGYGIGPMIWAPLSEIPYIGRNPVYMGTLVIFVALQAPTALSKSFGELMAFRFVTGFFGSPVLATGGASLADIWSPKKRAYAISIWGIAAISGPTLGPLIGGFAVQFGFIRGGFTAPWTWPIWELMWLSGFCLVFLFFLLPETHGPNILTRRARRLRKVTGNDKLWCEGELAAQKMTARALAMEALVRPFQLNFTEPMVFLLNLYIALIYGILYVWFESFFDVFVGIYGFGLGGEGLAYIGILCGSLIAMPGFFIYLYYYLEPRFDEEGNITPELRLPPCCIGAFCIPICLFWFGWSSRPDVHWIVPIIGSAWFSIGAFLLFQCILNYLPDAYPEYAASVLAGNDFMRSCFGAGFPMFASAMYGNLGVPWASSTLAFISIAFIPIPFVLYKYGGTLRNNYSKHARKDK